jgi:hypothetical protein
MTAEELRHWLIDAFHYGYRVGRVHAYSEDLIAEKTIHVTEDKDNPGNFKIKFEPEV